MHVYIQGNETETCDCILNKYIAKTLEEMSSNYKLFRIVIYKHQVRVDFGLSFVQNENSNIPSE